MELEPHRQTQVTAPLPSEPVANLVGQGSGESPVGKCRGGMVSSPPWQKGDDK